MDCESKPHSLAHAFNDCNKLLASDCRPVARNASAYHNRVDAVKHVEEAAANRAVNDLVQQQNKQTVKKKYVRTRHNRMLWASGVSDLHSVLTWKKRAAPKLQVASPHAMVVWYPCGEMRINFLPRFSARVFFLPESKTPRFQSASFNL